MLKSQYNKVHIFSFDQFLCRFTGVDTLMKISPPYNMKLSNKELISYYLLRQQIMKSQRGKIQSRTA